MLVIREAQLKALEAIPRASFVDKMMAHLRTFFPEQLGDAPDAELRPWIERALDKAQAYGLGAKRDACRFLNLCALVGPDFDESQRFQYIAQILNDPAVTDPGRRLERAMDAYVRRESTAERNKTARIAFAAETARIEWP